jgi:hypothetical protein
MTQNRVPITRLNKFFSEEDFNLDIEMGGEWLHGDMNFTLILYRVDRQRTDNDDVYGEATENGIQYLPPVEFKGLVKIEASSNADLGASKLYQSEPGNLTVSVYQHYLEDLGIEINLGDYIGYYETEDFVRYYSVVNDGRVFGDNKHTYAGYKRFYRTITAVPSTNNEFNGI